MIWRKRIPSQKNILVSWHENKFGIFEGRNEALVIAGLVRGTKRAVQRVAEGHGMQGRLVQGVWS